MSKEISEKVLYELNTMDQSDFVKLRRKKSNFRQNKQHKKTGHGETTWSIRIICSPVQLTWRVGDQTKG